MITTRGLRRFRKKKRIKGIPVILYINGIYPIFLNEIKPLYYEKFHGKMRFIKSIMVAKDYASYLLESTDASDASKENNVIEFDFSVVTHKNSTELEVDLCERINVLERQGNRECFQGIDCNETKRQIFDLRKELIVIRELIGKKDAD